LNSDDLVKEYLKKPSPKLREQVIHRFLPMVKYIIGRLNLSVRNRLELEDIQSAGVTGLIRALDDFDVSKNASFKTYATWRVRGFILDYLREIDFISRGDRAKLKEIERTVSALTLRFKREPLDFEIADEAGIELREYHRLLEMAQLNYTVSLDQPQYLEEEQVRLSDVLADEDDLNPFEQTSNTDLLHTVKEAIKKLPERPRMIVLMYYHDEMTLLEIGKVLNLSESRVSRLLGKAILSIRQELGGERMMLPREKDLALDM
jgi:RNA polymerase sigma factor for flagellar operon FliA